MNVHMGWYSGWGKEGMGIYEKGDASKNTGETWQAAIGRFLSNVASL